MKKQRIGRRRRRFYKKDAPVVTLASISVILLFVWGGLYWNESSEKALSADANVQQQDQQALYDEEGFPTADSADSEELTGLDTLGNNPSTALDESGTTDSTDSMVTSNGEREGNHSELLPSTDDIDSMETSVGKSNTQSADKSVVQSPTKSVTQSSGKSDEQSSTKLDTASPTKSEEAQGPTTSDTPSPTRSDVQSPSTSTNQVEVVVNQAEKYEQEILQVQAKCTKDMNVVLSAAEKSFKQLDMRDPVTVQEWKEKLTKESLTAESACESAFQVQIRGAENDSVSANVIEEWTDSYQTLRMRLKEESEAKLQQLLGG
ncbi:hypothetical protein J2T13_001341 [Paenibacillus sp. DS2015]|uniref:hypothetical protein n=1 Tax=Paenibacillus sp. DS2015 TaxID=3373917 RepID=UPI003D234E5C